MDMLILDALVSATSIFVAVVEVAVAFRFMQDCKSWQRIGMAICGFALGVTSATFLIIKILFAIQRSAPSMGLIQFMTALGIAENVAFGIILYAFAARKRAQSDSTDGSGSSVGPVLPSLN